MITREDLCNIVKEVYNDNTDKFLDDVENGCTGRFSVFCTINENSGTGDILILDNETNNFISWYKLTHLGRDIHSNITESSVLKEFIIAFKEFGDLEEL